MGHDDREERGNAAQRVLSRLGEWICRSELERMSGEDLGQFARDLGLGARDLARLATGESDASRLLYARLQSLGLSMSEIEAAGAGTARDMERACSACSNQAHCEHALAQPPEATDWSRVCPNQRVFDEMERLKKMQA